MDEIIQTGNPVLREAVKQIPTKEIKTQKTKDIVALMQDILSKEKDGVAIAAPQIGKSLSIFIVSGKILGENMHDKVFINPELIKTSRKSEDMHEGCLSVRGLYGNVRRSVKAKVRAYDKDGKRFTHGASGLLAQIFQHEMDHLNGVLFTDKATNLHEATVETQEKK